MVTLCEEILTYELKHGRREMIQCDVLFKVSKTEETLESTVSQWSMLYGFISAKLPCRIVMFKNQCLELSGGGRTG